MREQRHRRRTTATWVARRGVVATASVLAVALPFAPAVQASGIATGGVQDEVSAHRSAGAADPAAHRTSSAHRTRERRKLAKLLRAKPRAALRGSFLRRAALAGLRMPVTVRLREGTTIGITWAATRFPLDGALFPAPPVEQQIELAGHFPMVIDFGAGPGYGGPGNLQARPGAGGSITSAGPLVVAEPAGCAGIPPAFVEAATTTAAGAPIVASVATPTWVDLNPFSGGSAGYLDLKLSIRSRVLGAVATCGVPGPSADYEVPVSTATTDPWNAPVRIRWDGSFRVAPAIAADGAVRFGKISAEGQMQPQIATTGNLWGCAAQDRITGSGLPLLASPCTVATGPPLGEAVGPAPFPAALVVKRLAADILLGDRN